MLKYIVHIYLVVIVVVCIVVVVVNSQEVMCSITRDISAKNMHSENFIYAPKTLILSTFAIRASLHAINL